MWHINETIECRQLTNEYQDQVLGLMEKTFFTHGNVSQALGIPNDPEALLELRQVTQEIVKDGISIVAIDKKTSQVIGAAINKIQVKGNKDLENLISNWKNKKSITIVEFILECEKICDLYEKLGVDCILELFFLCTSPNYRGQGIAKKLVEITIEIGKDLSKGINVKKSLDGLPLPVKETPKLIAAIFSTFISQKIGKNLGFQIAGEKNYDDFVAKDGTTKITLEYRWLKISPDPGKKNCL